MVVGKQSHGTNQYFSKTRLGTIQIHIKDIHEQRCVVEIWTSSKSQRKRTKTQQAPLYHPGQTNCLIEDNSSSAAYGVLNKIKDSYERKQDVRRQSHDFFYTHNYRR